MFLKFFLMTEGECRQAHRWPEDGVLGWVCKKRAGASIAPAPWMDVKRFPGEFLRFCNDYSANLAIDGLGYGDQPRM
jgi:hypothetical protein